MSVSLAEYAFNFPEHGYEIVINGETGDFRAKASDDFIYVRDGGYTVWTRIARLSRTDRQRFLDFYNTHCKHMEPCAITAIGEIELDSKLKMVFHIQQANLSRDGRTLSTGAE